MYNSCDVSITIIIAENFRGRKHSQISRFQSHPQVFSLKFGRAIRTYVRFCIPVSAKMVTLTRSVKVFSLESFPLRLMSVPNLLINTQVTNYDVIYIYSAKKLLHRNYKLVLSRVYRCTYSDYWYLTDNGIYSDWYIPQIGTFHVMVNKFQC